ncbi:MAG: asparagine synthetase B, partial [Acidobacteria bacterium]
MCGIAGIAGEADELVVKDMLARIRHRGPDDTGIYATPRNHPGAKVAMGNNRLSILDLSPAGHQPTSNEDGTVWVAYNGEIYNFAELRQELENDGHRFLSHTDTEILPHLYEKYGPDMVNRLNGMFAFALWDGMAERLWLFRDRMGVKPLYYVQVGS